MQGLTEGSIVLLHAFDDIPEHLFRVHEVFDDCVSGYSLTGPLAGEYGEPSLELIKAIIKP
ncbi:hypothetical protein [Aestuariicoccus sp. MJ-SS9]|uniref:hypothetical protein n=1 Tax=Aestuariicoccus sp. MJ-SS9 TaxID=3079855 RepID=UPI002910C66A|nr:hypothetical protein [Aestuariicoccus sp. MJ-SS9]MDU8914140.1 hypothetical protein [Aestuariicoccus sp. MJ-SS9]